MTASPRTAPVSRLDQGQVHQHRAEYAGMNAAMAPRFRWHFLARPELPALLLVAVLVAWAAFTLHGAYEEGRACRARGGVIMEVDEGAYDSLQVKRCTADY